MRTAEQRREYQADYRAANKARLDVLARSRYVGRREEITARLRTNYAADPDKFKERATKFRVRDPLSTMLYLARSRAKRDGYACTIGVSDIVIPSVCPILGIPLARGAGKVHAGSPSLDRRDSNKGYIPGNVQVISHKANAMKQDADAKALHQFACWVLNNIKEEA